MLPETRQLNSPSPHPEGKGAPRPDPSRPPNNLKTLPESTTNETSELTLFGADQADGQRQAGIIFGQDAADVEDDFVVVNSNEDPNAASAESDCQFVGGKFFVLQEQGAYLRCHEATWSTRM